MCPSVIIFSISWFYILLSSIFPRGSAFIINKLKQLLHAKAHQGKAKRQRHLVVWNNDDLHLKFCIVFFPLVTRVSVKQHLPFPECTLQVQQEIIFWFTVVMSVSLCCAGGNCFTSQSLTANESCWQANMYCYY